MVKKLIEVIKNGELGWKFPKKMYLITTYGNSIFRIRNKSIKELVIEDKVARKLSKEYRQFISEYVPQKGESKINRTVWICWLQGIENAPDLVKACVNSIKNKLPGFKIVILTDENLGDYISLPDHIIDKYKKGIISRTHFSDILRISLLARYGGLWVDSTVLCTDGKFAERIISLPLFVYKVMELDRNEEKATICSSWLMAAQSTNNIMLLTRDLLYEYWKTHNYEKHFFIFHIFFAMAARKYRTEWESVPMFNNCSPHTLMFELGDTYSEQRWKEIEMISSFHKLTRHNQYDFENTNYGHILEEYLK